MTSDPGTTTVGQSEPQSGTAAAAARRAALIAALDVVDSGPEERFERITRIARETFGVTGAFINLADDRSLFIRSQQIDEPLEACWALDDTFCGRTMQREDPVVVPDARADPAYADLGFVTGDLQIRFYAGAPLHVGPDATKIGTLCLIDPEPRTLQPDDLQTLQELATWAERELTAGLDEDRLRAVLDGLEPRPVDLPGYVVAGLSIPNSLVPGDYHDWQLADDALHVTVADVMGKGMGAGLLAANLRGALIARSDLHPDDAVAQLEQQVAPELSRSEAFATLFHARLTPSTGRVDFVDAGHGLVLLLRADGSEEILRSFDLPLGLHPSGIPRTSGSLDLGHGDVLVVVTDGVLEIWDSTLASLSRLGEVYRASADVDVFRQRVRALAAEHDPGDDLTLVVLVRD